MVGRQHLGAILACGALCLVAPLAGAGAICPADVQVWETSGDLRRGAEWSARVMEIRQDVGIVQELVVRFGEAHVDDPWFEDEPWPHAVDFRTRELIFSEEEMRSFCEGLPSGQIRALRRSVRRCFVTSDGRQIWVEHRPESRSRGEQGGAFGVVVPRSEDEESCEPIESIQDLNPEDVPGGTPEVRAGADRAFTDLMRSLAGFDTEVASGLEALPVARGVMRLIEQHGADAIPEHFPSAAELALLAAPPDYGRAMAGELVLASDTIGDHRAALRWLSDECESEMAPLVRIATRSAVAAGDRVSTSLALRALLACDSQAARLEALPLLAIGDFRRPALGVFALSDAALRRDLDTVDPDDPDEVRSAAQRMIETLAAGADDDSLRDLAREILQVDPPNPSRSPE